MKKKLLIFHPTIAPYRIDFFNRLSQEFDTRICLQYWNLKDQKFDYQKIFDQFEFQPFYLPEGSTWKLCQAIKRQIKEFKPDLVITCEFGLSTMTALILRLLRCRKFKLWVMTDDSYDMLAESNDFTARHKRARQMMAPYIDDFIVVSPKVEEWYKKKYHKGISFPIIVDDDKSVKNYDRLLPLSRELANQYNLLGQKVILTVSRLVKLKNLHSVIDAFEKIHTDASLVIVGDGPERESLENHAKKVNKNILFTGRFDGDKLYAWYNLASVFILASYQEPFGAVTNEALLAGCRVIVSEKAGSSCLVSEKNGELVPPMDIKRLSQAIDNQLNLINVPNLITSRNSLMIVRYEELMNKLISKIKNTLH